MSGFANPVVGGQGSLVRPQIKSPDFSLAAKTGWAILRDGSAYFFNVTASGVVTANSVIIDGAGQGALRLRWACQRLTTWSCRSRRRRVRTAFGNAYSGPGHSGIGDRAPTGKNEIQIRPDKRAVFIYADS
jgi:hypothetical protein